MITWAGRLATRAGNRSGWPACLSSWHATNRRSVGWGGVVVKSVGEYADAVMVAVREDMAAGVVPWDVGTFSALHDYVDANCYLIDVVGPDYAVGMVTAGDEDADGNPLPVEVMAVKDAELEMSNAVSDEVDRRLAVEAVRLGTGARCGGCGRLVRYRGGGIVPGHHVHLDDGSHQCGACEFCVVPAVVREMDARNFPHDEPCPRCGRRQWGLGRGTVDPMNPDDAEQETCGACGYRPLPG